MPELLAEDVEGLAAGGQQRAEYDLGLSSWVAARRFCGPMVRVSHRFVPPHPSFADLARDAHWEPWDGGRPFRVLIDPTLSGSVDDHPALGWLLWLAGELPSTLSVSTLDDSVKGAATLRAIEVRANKPFDPSAVRDTEELLEVRVDCDSNGSPSRHVVIEAKRLERARRRMERHGRTAVVVRSALARELHKALDFDILVVAEEDAELERRWLEPLPYGIVTPSEGEQILGTLLRSRGSFPVRTWFGQTTIRFDELASVTAAATMPNTRAALASCLAPDRVDDHRPLADMLEAILTRQSDLLRAAQYLEEMNYLEGYYGGHHSLFLHQRYHLQNAVVLASGTADLLAQVMAWCAHLSIERNRVSWTKLMDRGSELCTKLRQANSPFLPAVRGHSRRYTLRLAYLLRDVYQHRHSLRGGVTRIASSEGVELFRKSCLCLSHNFTADDWNSRGLGDAEAIAGIFQAVGGDLYLVPHLFVRGLAAVTAELVDSVISEGVWPDSDWVEPDFQIGALSDELQARPWP